MAAAFDHIRHDLLFVTPDERADLARAGVKTRGYWRGSDHIEEHVLHERGGPKIGVILLPPVPYSARNLPENRIHQLEMAVRRLRAKVRLVVAMSPWGYNLERDLFARADKNDLPDVLLGSGPGVGQALLAAGGKTAWIRAYTEGKSVMRVDVFAWPEHDSTFKWTEDKNIRMSLFGLTDQYQEDPRILTLMQSMGTD